MDKNDLNEWIEELFEQLEVLFIGFLGALLFFIVIFWILHPSITYPFKEFLQSMEKYIKISTSSF